MSDTVDIAGLMAKATPGWEERVKLLADPELFHTMVLALPDLVEALTDEEAKRLKPKLKLVAQAAAWMAAGMVKGTIKYPGDDYSLDQWMAHLVGEGADQMNYQLLLFAAFHAKNAQSALAPTCDPRCA